MSADYAELPADLPAPEDDGAADHLAGMALPQLSLLSTLGGSIDLTAAATNPVDVVVLSAVRRELRHLVVFVYPRTGRPGEALPAGWDDIPGARGCTPQSCAYRDSVAELAESGASVIGISAQSPEEQLEFAQREHIPFPLLSDSELRLAATLGLPTFEVDGMTLYRRLTLVVTDAKIVKTFYPVFPPDRDASEVIAWLRGRSVDGGAEN